jgi:hypothetical protein
LVDKWSFVSLLSLAACPLAIQYSIELQIDNSSGFVIFFLVFLLVLFGKNPVSYFLAGLFASMGKNEWSLVFVAAIFFFCVFCIFCKRLRPSHLASIPALIIGIALGNAFSWWFDPVNYIEGLKLIPSRGELRGYLHPSFFTLATLTYFVELFTQIYPQLFLFGVTSYIVYKKFRDKELVFSEMFSYFIAGGLLFGFLLGGKPNHARYYIPAFVGLVVLFFYLYPVIKKRIHGQTMAFAALLILLHSAVYQYQTFAQKDKAVYVVNHKSCVPFTDCFGYIEGADFICKSLTREQARIRAKQYGATVCR